MAWRPKAPDGSKTVKPEKGYYFLAGRQYPRAKWRSIRNLRLLYVYCFFLILVNVANGFDGSMMNGLQSLPYWQDYFGHPEGSKLGILNAIYQIGSIASFPVA